MPLAANGSALLSQFLAFVSAFLGPAGSPPQTIPAHKKVTALCRFAQTGDRRDCQKILARIRKKKTWAEGLLEGHRKTRRELEAGIRNAEKRLRRAGAHAAMVQSQIEDLKQTVSIIDFLEPRLRQWIPERAREEKAFLQLYRFVEKTRKNLKAR
jgi:hypothetical protein